MLATMRKRPIRSNVSSRNIASVKSAMYGMNKNQLGSRLVTNDETISPTQNTDPARNMIQALLFRYVWIPLLFHVGNREPTFVVN